MASHYNRGSMYGRPAAATIGGAPASRGCYQPQHKPVHRSPLNVMGPSTANKPLPPVHVPPATPPQQHQPVRAESEWPLPAPAPVPVPSPMIDEAAIVEKVTARLQAACEERFAATRASLATELNASVSHNSEVTDNRLRELGQGVLELEEALQSSTLEHAHLLSTLTARISLQQHQLADMANQINILTARIPSPPATPLLTSVAEQERQIADMATQIRSLTALVASTTPVTPPLPPSPAACVIDEGKQSAPLTADVIETASDTSTPTPVRPHVHVKNGHFLLFHSDETPFDEEVTPGPNSISMRLMRDASSGDVSFQTCVMTNRGVWAVIQSMPVSKFLASMNLSASSSQPQPPPSSTPVN